ncbi:MAG: DUF192 domain-containing protein [Methanobacteriota archaeon]
MNRKHAIIAVVVVLTLISLAIYSLFYWYGVPMSEPRVGSRVFFGTGQGYTQFACEVADTPAEWTTGLSGREVLAENRGMIFYFPEPTHQSFWMKDTLIPLDIIFIWANYTIGAIYEAPTELGIPDENLTRYESPGMIKLVVELNIGVCAANGIVIGSQVSIEG